MNDQWDLSPLYSGFETEAFQKDYADFSDAVTAWQQFAQTLSGAPVTAAQLCRALELQERAVQLGHKLIPYAHLRVSTNANDTEAAANTARLQRKFSDTSAANAAFTAYLARAEHLDELIAQEPLLQEYDFLLHEQKAFAAYTLDEKVEDAIAKMNLSGGHAWENLQQYMTSNVEADYRGSKLTLSAVRNLAYDGDAAVRKDAYDAEIACYDKIKDGVCFALNSLKQQVTTVCELRGAESPLAMTLLDSRMQRSTLDAMIAAIEEYLPHFHRYLKAKAHALGYEGGLKWWDLFAPMGKNDRTYTVDEAKDYLLTHFRSFAPDMAEMMGRAFDERWIDFFPRKGKRGGAFCYNLAHLNQSRILTNFDGAFGDIVTLAHELGHAYHGQQIETHRPMNLGYSMPVAETASTFNETVIMNAALAEANDPQVELGLLESRLQDTTQIICDILSRYLFETAVFAQSKERFLYPDDLCALMTQAQRRGYGDGVDPETLHPYMWVCKSHYYSSGLSFYNFPYAFGGLFAAGLYAQYRAEGEAFLPKYRALLHATTVSTVEDVAKMADIDLGDINFWRSSLEIFKAQIDRFVELVSE